MTKTRDEVVEDIKGFLRGFLARYDSYESDDEPLVAEYANYIAAGVIPQHNPDMKDYVMRCPECKEFHARLSCHTPPHNTVGGE